MKPRIKSVYGWFGFFEQYVEYRISYIFLNRREIKEVHISFWNGCGTYYIQYHCQEGKRQPEAIAIDNIALSFLSIDLIVDDGKDSDHNHQIVPNHCLEAEEYVL